MTVADQAASLREDFAFLEDWEARFAHLIDLGKALPPLRPEEYSDANKVRGCSSQVWLVAEASETKRVEQQVVAPAAVTSIPVPQPDGTVSMPQAQAETTAKTLPNVIVPAPACAGQQTGGACP